jgi:hypothetical protein
MLGSHQHDDADNITLILSHLSVAAIRLPKHCGRAS